ncbi:MAG TPA: DMT family transporter [Actinomycetota bacterium]|nr:DMT family transporter [Actinomycetota bacterium]
MRAPLGLADRPLATAALGAVCIASSGVLVRLASSSPVTVAIYRCLYALPVLGAITYLETRRFGVLPQRTRNLAWVAGMFFALDLVFWHNAIDAVGAGLATVLGNLQVLIVGFAAWALLGERPRRQLFWAIPVVLTGVVLISGAVGSDAYGDNPALGVVFGGLTSLAYAAFILVLREGSRDLRRVAGPLFHATLVSAVVAALYGAVAGDVAWGPRWPEHGWLVALALSAQVVGWLLISRSLPRLPAAVTSIVLLLQPVGAMVIAAIALGEDPGIAQLFGAALILAGVVVATSGTRRPAPAPDGAGV